MRLTILGCGTSTGVPLIHCKCRVCRSRSLKNKRLRASAWLEIRDKSFLIDTATDLRQQAIRAKIPRIDVVLFTHPHADHVQGIDELRSFNFVQKAKIPVYGNEWTCSELKTRFSYIFHPDKVEGAAGAKPSVSPMGSRAQDGREGGGIPQLELHQFDASSPLLEIAGEKIIPVPVSHGSKECVGYRFGAMAYITDCSYIPSASMDRLKGLSVLVLDCLRLEPHGTHFNLDQALETISQLKPKKTFLTHLGHDFDYHAWRKRLPKRVFFAYDGLSIDAH